MIRLEEMFSILEPSSMAEKFPPVCLLDFLVHLKPSVGFSPLELVKVTVEEDGKRYLMEFSVTVMQLGDTD